MKRQAIGALGEKLAADYIRERGYHILETNYRVKEGEADIIAEDAECLVFIEVRTKTSLVYGTPEESITPTKKAHLIAVANRYLQKLEKQPSAWRIDMVAIEMDLNGGVKRLNLIQNAVEDN